jgi:NADPH:quinone reductase-like Zn-dependent oxidoreductase
VHALVDLVDRGHDDFRRALEVLDDGGYAVSAFGAATGAGRPDVDVTNVLLEPVPGQLAELAGLVADGRLRVPIAAEIALDDVVGALQGARARRERGAVVVTIAAD